MVYLHFITDWYIYIYVYIVRDKEKIQMIDGVRIIDFNKAAEREREKKRIDTNDVYRIVKKQTIFFSSIPFFY